MSTSNVAKIVLFAFVILTLLVICFYLYKDTIFPPTKAQPKVDTEQIESTPIKSENAMKADRIEQIEEALSELKKEQDNHTDLLDEVSKKVKSIDPDTNTLEGKKILATARAQGGQYSSSSTVYSPMGMYVNVTCPRKCVLWIDFFTSSTNLDPPASLSSTVNTYGLFLNNQDKSVYSQGSIPSAGSAIPISLNAAYPLDAGTHTIDIRAKTTAGTLRSDVSFLQVMAVEQ